MPAADHFRWKTSDFAVGYDSAADVVHPQYIAIQDEILRQLELAAAQRSGDWPAIVVDLGGGSGRLMERLLDRWPQAKGFVIDMSEPFLALAERRLARFGERARCIFCRLQDDWPGQVGQAASAIVSMSAIHHLEPAEKQSVYRRCHDALAANGVLVNGDEVRPADDDAYLAELTNWAEHMRRSMQSGAIPQLFHPALEGWIERNVQRFGEPKHSGDDCHETIDVQLRYLQDAGFAAAECPWQRDLWAVLRGQAND
jgi:cyclopropane fatty-acyl-phospholipid synthase-like methyltransferase